MDSRYRSINLKIRISPLSSIMNEEIEPRLESYGLNADSYSNFKSQISDLQAFLGEYKAKLYKDLEEHTRSVLSGYNRREYRHRRSSRAEINSFRAHVNSLQTGPEAKLYEHLRGWRRAQYRESSQTRAHSFLSTAVIFAFLFGIFATFGFLISGEYFLAVMYWAVVWYLNVVLREGDERLNAQSDEIDEENKKKRDITEEKIELIKNEVLPFEDACVAYYTKYLEQYYQNHIYRKRSGSEKFEEALVEFSGMLEEVKDINSKLIFRTVRDTHEEYLSSRKSDHDSQKAKKKYFHSLGGVVSVKPSLAVHQTAVVSRGDFNKVTFDGLVFQRKPTLKEEYRATRTSSTRQTEQQPVLFAHELEESVERKKPARTLWERFIDLEHINNPDMDNPKEEVEPLETHYRAPRKVDWDVVNKKKQETGLKGEDIVMAVEQDYLNSLGLPDLANRVRHVSKDDGDGSGYDILSFFPDEREKYIEVKSTSKSSGNSFYLSRNELEFLKNNKEGAQIHRVFNVNDENDDGVPYLQIYTAPDILESGQITPTQYKVKIG